MEKLYIVHQGDGLKSHLSTDPEGDTAICGHKIEHYDKEVEYVDELMSITFLGELGKVCERCYEKLKKTLEEIRGESLE